VPAAPGALIFLDEMQAVNEQALAAICIAMNRVGQRGLPVALVGAGLPPRPRLLRAAKPYPGGCSPNANSTGSPTPKHAPRCSV
jgi:hypothetical protein